MNNIKFFSIRALVVIALSFLILWMTAFLAENLE